MRSCFLENLSEFDSTIELSTRSMHHLVNVIRLQVGDELKFFDRDKNVVLAKTVDITKKNIIFKVLDRETAKASGVRISVAIGKLKKDAMDLAIKQLIEIGVPDIYIFESTFSQSYPIKDDRLEKIVLAAMEQSNNFNYPKIQLIKFSELLATNKNKIYFSSVATDHQKIDTFHDDSLIIIGPEGGMSESEQEQLVSSSIAINLPTFIMRASTAVSYCTGFISGKTKFNV